MRGQVLGARRIFAKRETSTHHSTDTMSLNCTLSSAHLLGLLSVLAHCKTAPAPVPEGGRDIQRAHRGKAGPSASTVTGDPHHLFPVVHLLILFHSQVFEKVKTESSQVKNRSCEYQCNAINGRREAHVDFQRTTLLRPLHQRARQAVGWSCSSL